MININSRNGIDFLLSKRKRGDSLMVNIIKQEIEMEIASSITLDNMKKKGTSKQLLPNNQ